MFGFRAVTLFGVWAVFGFVLLRILNLAYKLANANIICRPFSLSSFLKVSESRRFMSGAPDTFVDAGAALVEASTLRGV